MLSSVGGIYVTYQVLDGNGDQLSEVDAEATRIIEGETLIIGNGQTDAAGLVTFWMNPDFVHSLTFVKSGYDTFSLNHFPTQSAYTITLGGTSTSGIIDYLLGMIWSVKPTQGTTLEANTNYHFNFSLNSSYHTVTSFGFDLYGDGIVIGGNSSTTINTTTFNLINVSNYSKISMDYYWIVNGTTQEGTNIVWNVFDSADGTAWSITNLFTDITTYAGEGIFGLDQDALNLIIFLIIFLVVGISSYKFGITSSSIVSGMVFILVALFDWGLGMIDIGVVGSVEHFPTIFIGLITIAMIIKEATQ